MEAFLAVRRVGYLVLSAAIHATLFLTPNSALRVRLLRLCGAKVGARTYIDRRIRFDFPWRLQIGRSCHIGRGVYLDCRGGTITIGDNTDISHEAILFTLTHDINTEDFAVIGSDLSIGSQVWICCRAIVLPGSSLGDGAVLGANSVFRGTASPYTLYRGNPAVHIRNLSEKRATRVRQP